jgi:hypothetical protein
MNHLHDMVVTCTSWQSIEFFVVISSGCRLINPIGRLCGSPLSGEIPIKPGEKNSGKLTFEAAPSRAVAVSQQMSQVYPLAEAFFFHRVTR